MADGRALCDCRGIVGQVGRCDGGCVRAGMHAPSYPMTGSDRLTQQASHDSPGRVIGGLDDIANDMAMRMNPYETAASDRARLGRDWERRMAICIRQAQGPNAEVRKANALVHAIEMDDLYDRLTDAEARFEALRVVLKVLSDRSMIGMAILRAQGRG